MSDFFYDLKLVKKEEDTSGRIRYTFDGVVRYIQDLEGSYSYKLEFNSSLTSNICPDVEAVVAGAAGHFRVECLLPAPDTLTVVYSFSGPRGEAMSVEYRF